MLEAKDILNTVIGAVIGGGISWWVTHLYFVKSQPLEKATKDLLDLSESIRTGLRASLVYRKYPEFFESPEARELVIPKINEDEPDVPQLDRVIFDRSVAKPGKKVNVLFKVLDLGLNFSNPDGAEVFDHHGQKLYLQNAGFGFLLTSFSIPQSDPPGRYYLKFHLTDIQPEGVPPNKMKYSVEFSINGIK